MKSTTFATAGIAFSIQRELLSRRRTNGKPMFTKEVIDGGFEIRGKQKVGETWEPCTVFRYIATPARFDYDERVLTFEK